MPVDRSLGSEPPLAPVELAERLYALGWRDPEVLHRMLRTVLAVSGGHPGMIALDRRPLNLVAPGWVVREFDAHGPPPRTGPPLVVVRPQAGILRVAATTEPRQLDPLAPVVVNAFIGLAGLAPRNGLGFGLAGDTLYLRDSTDNLRAARLLYVRWKMRPWDSFTEGPAAGRALALPGSRVPGLEDADADELAREAIGRMPVGLSAGGLAASS